MQGDSSTTLQRTLRARQDTQALAARRLVTFAELLGSVALESERFLVLLPVLSLVFELLMSLSAGGGEPAADVSEASEVIFEEWRVDDVLGLSRQ